MAFFFGKIMRLNDAKWVVRLLAAVKEGKTLQIKSGFNNEWRDMDPKVHYYFGGGADNYRIKPESKTFTQYLIYTDPFGKGWNYWGTASTGLQRDTLIQGFHRGCKHFVKEVVVTIEE